MAGNAVCEALHLAAGGDVGEPDFVGESDDELVAAGGKFGGSAVLCSGETGENQQATVCQRRLPVGDCFPNRY